MQSCRIGFPTKLIEIALHTFLQATQNIKEMGVSKTPTRGRRVFFFSHFFVIYLQIDSFWSKRYLLVYNGKSF